MSLDSEIRIWAFKWLSEQIIIYGDVLPRKILETGFIYKDIHVPLVSPQRIYKPKSILFPLTITTSPRASYENIFSKDGFLIYKYSGTDLNFRDNVGLREAMENSIPLIYFHGIVTGKYLVVFPVYIIADDLTNLRFTVAVDELKSIDQKEMTFSDELLYKRAYITSTVRTRLHQRCFRERVLKAYGTRCAFCQLRHSELLDAAQIISDIDPQNQSTVNNGLALCKLHFAAFNSFLLDVNPDYIIEVREDVLDEKDGLMLQYGLKALHHHKIILPPSPSQWPNRQYLEIRYQKFKKAI